MTTLWVCAQQQLLGVPTEGQLLVLLHCANERIGDMCYDNRTTFHCLVPGGQGKNIYFRNVHFWLFAYRLVREGLSQGVASTITTFLETTWTELYHFDFSFFCDVIFKGWTGLENSQNFINNCNFLVARAHKNDPMAFALWHVADCVNFNMSVKL